VSQKNADYTDYGEYGVWVRPASMWNEKVERSGIIMKRYKYVGE